MSSIFDLFSYYNHLEIDGGSFFNFISNLKRNFNDDDKKYFIQEKKFYEYFTIFPFINHLLTISILNFSFLLGIFLNVFFKFYLDRTKYYRFHKKAKLMEKLMKKRKKYNSLNLFQKWYYYIQVYYILFDPYTIIHFHKKLLFIQNIFKLSEITYLFYIKYNIIDLKYLIIYYLLYLTISIFLLNHLIRMYQSLKSLSLFQEIIIVLNKEENWFLVFYEFIYLTFNLAILFTIFIFKPYPIFCFSVILLLMIVEIVVILSFFKKSLIYYVFMNVFTLVVFFLWVIMVFIGECFSVKFPLVLNIFYVTANLSKIISQVIISNTLRKMKKEIRIGV